VPYKGSPDGLALLGYVQEPLTAGELARVRHSVVRGTPFGETGHSLR
jgi:hypothetical protein